MKIKKFIPKDHKIKALIYGAAGSGKTVFGGTAAKAIFASAEGGLLSIAEKTPDFVEVKSLKDLTDLYSFLNTQEHSYETLVIDSITEINEVIKLEIEKRVGRAMQIQDWGEIGKKIRSMLRLFRDLPMDVVFVAQEKYITDEDRIKKIVPSLSGKAATEVAYFMDIVGYIHIENDGTRWIETESNKNLLTKDRSRLIGNDSPLDFTKWKKKVLKIEIGEQKLVEDYVEPIKKATTTAATAQSGASAGKPHLLALQKELKNMGATNKAEAIALLNKHCSGDFDSLDMQEGEAKVVLISILKAGAKKKSDAEGAAALFGDAKAKKSAKKKAVKKS